MGDKINNDDLCQSWVHSHEEDSDAEIVFRPADYDFPLSRGRRSFELKPDGSLVQGRIGPADRSREEQGTWELDADNDLILRPRAQAEPGEKLRLAAVRKNKLTVKK